VADGKTLALHIATAETLTIDEVEALEHVPSITERTQITTYASRKTRDLLRRLGDRFRSNSNRGLVSLTYKAAAYGCQRLRASLAVNLIKGGNPRWVPHLFGGVNPLHR